MTFELAIERPVAGGRMLARHDGQVVLVSGAIPGERVRASVERTQRRVVFARTIEVLEASPHRRSPTPDPACGGLLLNHIAYAHQLEIKSQILVDTFRRVGKLSLPDPPTVQASPETGYRLRARLHVDRGRVGFYREGSRMLCDAAPSQQLLPAALPAVDGFLRILGAAAANVTAITIAENVKGTSRLLAVELRAETALPRSIPALPEGIDGVGVLGDGRLQWIAGADSLLDSAADLGVGGLARDCHWRRSAASFFQGNRYLIGKLVDAVMAKVPHQRVADLYAGVGLFSVPLAVRGATVTAVEGDTASGNDLVENAREVPGLTAALTSVEDALGDERLVRADCVIVDPPRTGLSTMAGERLAKVPAKRIVYVSCDPATLARDTALLIQADYALVSVEGFDMFPNTPHIEAMAVFERQVR